MAVIAEPCQQEDGCSGCESRHCGVRSSVLWNFDGGLRRGSLKEWDSVRRVM